MATAFQSNPSPKPPDPPGGRNPPDLPDPTPVPSNWTKAPLPFTATAAPLTLSCAAPETRPNLHLEFPPLPSRQVSSAPVKIPVISPFAAKVAAARPFVPAAPPSYASIIAGPPALQPRFPPILLPPRQAGTKEGKPAVSFSNDEIQVGSNRFNCSLVAKFTYGKPPVAEIQRAFQTHWKTNGRVTISDVWDNRHVLVMLDSEEDITIALSCPLRKINRSMFRLFRWSLDYNPKKESTITTAWVRLPRLPLPLFDRAYIGAIVSSFAHFLDVDDRTKACLSLKCARACIEIDVNQTIPDKVWVNMGDADGFWQDIEIETKLAYCSKCRVHGHGVADCRKAKASMEHKGKTALKSDYGPDMLFSVTIPQHDDRGEDDNVQKDGDTSKEDEASKLQETNPVEVVSDTSKQTVVERQDVSKVVVVYEGVVAPSTQVWSVMEIVHPDVGQSSAGQSLESPAPDPAPLGPRTLGDYLPLIMPYLEAEGIFEIPEVYDDSFLEIASRAAVMYRNNVPIPVAAPREVSPPISDWIPAKALRKKKGKKLVHSESVSAFRRFSRDRQSTEGKNPDFIYRKLG